MCSSQMQYSQCILDSLDIVYNKDPILYSGIQYTYFGPINAKGNQFYLDKDFCKGEMQVRGKVYKNLDLNYDILNQQLLLKISDAGGTSNTIIIPNHWLEKFVIYNKTFELLKLQDKSKKIYQVIGIDSCCVLYHWKKQIRLTNVSRMPSYEFYNLKTERYIFNNQRINQYKSNKSFLKSFSKEESKMIKKYIKENKINVKRISDKQMLELLKIYIKP